MTTPNRDVPSDPRPLTPEEVAQLKAAAEKATPGPYRCEWTGREFVIVAEKHQAYGGAVALGIRNGDQAAFLALCSPDRILALLAGAQREAVGPETQRKENTGMEPGRFHWTDGWYFKRMDDGPTPGSVLVLKEQDGQVVVKAVIPAAEWESIISFVSAKGEPRNYEAAIAFHMVP